MTNGQAGQANVSMHGERIGVMNSYVKASRDLRDPMMGLDSTSMQAPAADGVTSVFDWNRHSSQFLKSLALRLHMMRLLGPLTLDQLTFLVKNGKVIDCMAGDCVIDTDAVKRYHLVVLEGEVEIQRSVYSTSDNSGQFCSRLVPADVIGRFAFMNAPVRPVSVTAITKSRCLLIDAESVDEQLGWYPQINHLKRDNPLLWQRAARIRSVSLFYRMPPYQLEPALHHLTSREASTGETVIREGEAAEYYYAIEAGNAEAWCTDPITGKAECVAELGPGDAFGLEIPLQSCYRMTVKMLTHGRLLTFGRTDFEELAARDMHDVITAESASALVGASEARLLDCRSSLELQESSIPSAVTIALDRLAWNIHTLDIDATYVVCCRNGLRSRIAAHLLRVRHIKAHALAGGLNAWPYELERGRAELCADRGGYPVC